MIAMRDLLTVTHLTLHEAMRRRILTAALLGGLAYLMLFSVGFHFMVHQIGTHRLSLSGAAPCV